MPCFPLYANVPFSTAAACILLHKRKMQRAAGVLGEEMQTVATYEQLALIFLGP